MIKTTTRRDFLKLCGYSFVTAAVAASCRRPVLNALPYIKQPPEITPGKAVYYASTYFDGHEYASILVKTRDGRPIKIEPNPVSVFCGQGTTARVQASVLSLYDDARLKGPSIGNQPSSWNITDREITGKLETIKAKNGNIVLLTSSIISPTTRKVIGDFGKGFSGFRWIQYDPVSYSAILEANAICFGREVIPDYRFENAGMVVAFNADFLGTWIAPAHFIAGYAARRKPDDRDRGMLTHIQYETGMTITGANADIRRSIRPSEEYDMLVSLHNEIASEKGAEPLQTVPASEEMAALASSLIRMAGKSIVISGTNDKHTQIIVNGINHLLGNYEGCIDLNRNIMISSSIDSKMEEAVNDMLEGRVGALIMYNVNPVYDYHDPGKFLEGLKKVELSVNMAEAMNETTGVAGYECPVPHFLESWDDSEPVPGQLTLTQPCINNIFNTRSFQESLLRWQGQGTSYHDVIRSEWEKNYFVRSGNGDFSKFWNNSLQNGGFTYTLPPAEAISFNPDALKSIMNSRPQPLGEGGFEVQISEGIALGNGRHANNPWLMELPDPIYRQCWENVAAISENDAQKLDLLNGDLVKLGEGAEIPVYIQRGQATGTITVFMGYGHSKSGPVADKAGINLFPFAKIREGNRSYLFRSDIRPTGRNKSLALSQVHGSMEGRPIVRDTVLSRYIVNRSSGNEMHGEFESRHQTLYPEVRHDAFHWAMAIDLNACVGCNACVIACQAENNIPVVGRDQVNRRRIMHWLKIDRYYTDDPGVSRVYFQPLPCQHCDNAPCENVCPVSATNHSSEGLNQMTYNRCVGTKYCINNCPYKVRRFNWYRYTNNKAFDFNTASDLGKMVLNPDVTVRERGVVEKCSFCVQRIQEKKLAAKLENRLLSDLEIKPACMQACPAGAIVFGNLNDPDSKVSGMFREERCYHLLEELHTLPSVGYLAKVWNDTSVNS